MAQEVFRRLISVLETFEYERDKGRFRGYLKTVTHRLTADLKERSAPVSLLDHRMLVEIEARQDMLDRLESLFDLELVARARTRGRDRVEDRTFAAYVGTAEEGRKPAEVARELGMKVGAVFQARYTVMTQLRREIEILQGAP